MRMVAITLSIRNLTNHPSIHKPSIKHLNQKTEYLDLRRKIKENLEIFWRNQNKILDPIQIEVTIYIV